MSMLEIFATQKHRLNFFVLIYGQYFMSTHYIFKK